MPIVELYSNRGAGDTQPDVWVYDQIPQRLRVQVRNIMREAIGFEPHSGERSDAYYSIEKTICNEHGILSLAINQDSFARVEEYILTGGNLSIWLDIITLAFRFIDRVFRKLDKGGRSARKITAPADEAISVLNERFRRAGFGFEFRDEMIWRKDSEIIHQTVTIPVLALLRDARFAGANDEFRRAHEHYKAGEFKDCAVDALNALESTMKAICDLRKWDYPKGARASDLIRILRAQGLFPEFADRSFDQLMATIQSGLPLVRNEAGAHGQGSVPVETLEYVATYALNLCAAKIKFLYDAFAAGEAHVKR
ncbi:hypothetical protein SAMN05519103_03414 [Rhizobiales bacterium GAS113]|nr:hypothetical protein SAMN05519103_03414 [Rhizobiales bacterium GAS113]